MNGESHEASDLDLVVRTPDLQPVKNVALLDFEEALRHSNIPILIQALDWARIPESFQRNILKKYHILFSRL